MSILSDHVVARSWVVALCCQSTGVDDHNRMAEFQFCVCLHARPPVGVLLSFCVSSAGECVRACVCVCAYVSPPSLSFFLSFSFSLSLSQLCLYVCLAVCVYDQTLSLSVCQSVLCPPACLCTTLILYLFLFLSLSSSRSLSFCVMLCSAERRVDVLEVAGSNFEPSAASKWDEALGPSRVFRA